MIILKKRLVESIDNVNLDATNFVDCDIGSWQQGNDEAAGKNQALIEPMQTQASPTNENIQTQQPSRDSCDESLQPQQVTHTHAMRTRSLDNIFKPKKLFASTKHPLPPEVEANMGACSTSNRLKHHRI